MAGNVAVLRRYVVAVVRPTPRATRKQPGGPEALHPSADATGGGVGLTDTEKDMTTRPQTKGVTSADGTTVGYLCQGAGDSVVLVQGAMADVYAYRELARELSSSFTVITAERRGRGLSPRSYSAEHDLARDVEDVEAIMAATGATSLFGLSLDPPMWRGAERAS